METEQAVAGTSSRKCAWIIWIAAISMGPLACAQIPSFTRTDTPGSLVRVVSAADLNRDGKPDLITACDGHVYTSLGKGDGTFQPAVDTVFSGRAGALVVADLNQDGKPDVVTSDDNGYFWIFLGKGDGTFQLPIQQRAYVGALAIGDFNTDGIPDLASANPNGVWIYLGNGDGSFQQTPLITALNTQFSRVRAADLNGDGKLDLVTLNYSLNAISVFLGKGDGTFQPGVNYLVGTYGFVEPLAIGDVNHDGKPDILVGARGFAVFLGNGDGTFGSPRIITTPYDVTSLTIADFNQDGKSDVAVTSDESVETHAFMIVYLGNNDGTFSFGVQAAIDVGTTSIVAADLNGDGKPDIATAESAISLFLNNGPGPEMVSAPAGLNGITSLPPGSEGVFDAAAAWSSFAHPIQYLFDWGDGTNSGWLPVDRAVSWHSWPAGSYTVRAQVRCSIHTSIVSSMSAGWIVTVEIPETVSGPTTLTGPTQGSPGTSYVYSTGGAVSSRGNPVQYLFGWGDNSDSGWLPVGITSASHSWPERSSPYYVTASARSATNSLVVSSSFRSMSVHIATAETVSTPTTMNGPVTGFNGVSYAYSTGISFDSLGNPLQYLLDWGDGSNTGWLPVDVIGSSHRWQAGSYTLRCQARSATNTSLVSGMSAGLNVTITVGEAISMPSKAAGPTLGVAGTSYVFTTGGAVSTAGNPVQYLLDWGDGSNSGWLPGTTSTASHSWTDARNYGVRAQARSATNPSFVSAIAPELIITIVAAETVSVPVSPSGQSDGGVIGVSYAYTTGGAVSNIGSPVQYLLDWGDGSNSGWLASGTKTASHSWTSVGSYTVRGQARSIANQSAVSSMSAGLNVRIGIVETVSTPATPAGPADGRAAVLYTYAAGGALTSAGSPVEYMFDWGDGSTNWLPVGTTSASHSWAAGSYSVRARARSATSVSMQSAWSSGLIVSISSMPVASSRINLTVWRPADGNWYVDPANGLAWARQWGLPGDIPLAGDFAGDGNLDYAVWRPSQGNWYLTLDTGTVLPVKQWGLPGDIPVPGDYDADGKTDYAVWRPSSGTWYVILSSTGAPVVKQWGLANDVPIVADFDGDGKVDYVVWRPTDGNWYATLSGTGQTIVKPWGLPGDKPIAADYDGDGKADYAIWRPAEGNWYITLSSTGAQVVKQWGLNGDIPVPRDYDGDGKADDAVWRPSNGTWYIIPTTTPSAPLAIQWGLPGDVPVYKPAGN